MTVKAELDVLTKTIKIEQRITYQNNSDTTLNTIYLNDWNNSYSTKTTPLAKRFSEEFNNKFHFAKNKERGFTVVTSILDGQNNSLTHSTVENHPDIIKVDLQTTLQPGESYTLNLNYNLVIPDDKFTNNGITEDGNLNLKYWYISPSVFDGKWHYYSNKNLDDLYTSPSDITLKITYPTNYVILSELNTLETTNHGDTQTTTFFGKNRINPELIVTKFSDYEFVQTDDFTIQSNIDSKGVNGEEKALITDKITRFITDQLGDYPHDKLLLSEIEYDKDPLYGLSQLPSFLRPFPDNFQYEMKLLKTTLRKYLENTMLVNPRKDYWLRDGLQVYYFMKYIETYYPDSKFLGSIANIWGVRAFHAADLDYNTQFNLFFMQMARTNRDQPLSTSKDSLKKFNANIANKYKAGLGLKYLDDFINEDILEETIKSYVKNYKLKASNSKNFENLLKQNTSKNVNWFFTDYINTRKKIDFKIKDISHSNDSVTLTIKNKRDNLMPVSLYTLKGDSIVNKQWIENISGTNNANNS